MNTISDCQLSQRTQPNPFIVGRPLLQPPLVFTDVNPGYMTQIGGEVYGYKNTVNTFFSIAECSGFNAFVTDEAVGIGIFIERELYALVNIGTEDAFGTLLESEVERSIVCFERVTQDTILLVICANIDPENDKVLYVSKTISIDSLYCSIRTRIFPSQTKRTYLDEYFTIVDDDLIVIKWSSEMGRVVDPDLFVGSYGFSDLTSIVIDVEDDKNGLLPIYKQVLSDVASIIPGFGDIVSIDSGIYSMVTEFIGGKTWMGLLSGDNFTTIEASGGVVSKTEYPFLRAEHSPQRDNMLFKYIQPAHRDAKVCSYVFAPAGVFKENVYYKYFYINRVEKDGDDVVISIYKLELNKEQTGYRVVSSTAGAMLPVSSVKIDNITDAVRSVFYSEDIGINIDVVDDTKITSFELDTKRNKNTIARNQKTDIIITRTMCNFIDYLYLQDTL